MYTLLRKAEKSLIVSAVVLVFGMIYEHFSHEVYSAAMVYAFLIPLLGSALPYFLAAKRAGEAAGGRGFSGGAARDLSADGRDGNSGNRVHRAADAERPAASVRKMRIAENFWNSGIAALTVGCIFHGVLEIYGTTNQLMIVYWIAGGGFCALGFLLFLAVGGREHLRFRSERTDGPRGHESYENRAMCTLTENPSQS